MNPPRFFYFDLGNVLLHFDHAIAIRRLAARASVPESVVRTSLFEQGWQDRYERGEITSEQFAAHLCDVWQAEMELPELLTLCSDIFRLNVSVVPIVTHLRAAGHRLGVLSNTCVAHWEFVARGRFRILAEPFEQIVLSYEVGAMKPAAEIYRRAAEQAGVAPHEIFFTDDREENVAGALAAGWDATLFQNATSLLEQLHARQVRLNL